MLVKHVNEVELTQYEGQDSQGVAIRPLITAADGAPTFAIRYFEIAPGGYTPHHSHDWEHEVFVLQGEGTVTGASGTTPLAPGTAVFIPGQEKHQFRNTGQETLVFTCVVPNQGQR